ncbi:glycosyltransferase family 4 protein [Candidatus Uhrbacteria bacterium CG_4_10_14_0_8_um_filter_58_22]|uniref:Glycosyltransferase family 4 protein n=1 Tax=Candidatus Uhrbacteria bacterium CG_4_10_14_0_8_um_filter_58_22 TaxID=1975029 RepID=A0A2M7QA32_9BACT|nr:MAG: glycosyltransferase family 4 protein [Candidatus Uhrbacteria bacterium CG_4_10_14_0_8_um_filter_58_22]
MKIALVHDYLIQDGGAERVFKTFHEVWPKAPIFALLHDEKRFGKTFRGDIRTSFLQRIPFSRRRFRWLMPLMPAATEGHNLNDFDLVLSSTSAFAKGVITKPETLHVSYCHTPTRYLWSDTHTYVNEIGLPRPVRSIMPLLLSSIRSWDRNAADRVDRFVANSQAVRHRIAKYYRRDSTVIHPPVDTHNYSISPRIDDYYLAGGRLVAYKRFDVVIRAFNKLGIPLKIFGEGPSFSALRRMARPNVDFVGKVNERQKAELYARAIAYLHPQDEDFGITPVESMAAGRPVIAYRRGGALETVVDGMTGTFLEDQSWEELANCVIRFEPEKFDPQKIRRHAEQFDTSVFKRRIKDFVRDAYQEHLRNEEDFLMKSPDRLLRVEPGLKITN